MQLLIFESGSERAAHAAIVAERNAISAERDTLAARNARLDAIIQETLMRLTARKSKRVKKPVYHYVISWHRDESPDDGHMRLVADTTCQDLGLDDYQRLYVAHRDTDHHHVHIVVNRVHPETGTAWKNSHDYRRIEVSLRRQAEAMGMDYVPGRHNDPERFHGRARRPVDREEQRGRRLGETPLPRWDEAKRVERRDQLQDIFARASSWEELDQALAAKGVNLTRKGQGLVLGDETGTMKLSDLGHDVRLKGLEDRFGTAFADYDQMRGEAPIRKQDERAAAFEEMADVGAKADMTYYLYRAGILRSSPFAVKRLAIMTPHRRPILTPHFGEAFAR